MGNVILDQDLIVIGLDAATKEVALERLGQRLLGHDLVTSDYLSHVLERERNFPTGLPTVIPVALCHTEAQYVKHSALAMATLRQPAVFQEMGTPEHTVAAEIVFLLALNDPQDQVTWLKKLVTLFKNETFLRSLKDSATPGAACRLLTDNLN